MKLLEARNISFSYNGEHGKSQILEDFSLSAEKGDFISILGSSGCGKSTLLSLLSGFKICDSGEVFFKDYIINSPFPEGQVVFQDTGQLLPWLTVGKNILFPRFRYSQLNLFSKKNKQLIKEEDLLFFNELIALAGLEKYTNYLPNQLSGGLKQRVSLVRAIFAKPEILFMDEPFVSLDAPSRSELQQFLLKIWSSKNKTIFFVTHDISEALLLSDKILIFSGDNNIDLIDNKLERPRNRDSEGFIKEKLRLYSIIDC